jgi:hypothetical protein
MLTAKKTGNGNDTVTSADGGINCGTDCTETYGANTRVTLAATPAVDAIFTGWSGGGVYRQEYNVQRYHELKQGCESHLYSHLTGVVPCQGLH